MRRDCKRKIVTAKNIGFCSGVDRAINLAEEYAKKFNRVLTLDALLHNEEELKRLEREGVFPVNKVDLLSGDVILLPAHGATKEENDKAKKRFKKVIDTTCPLVLRTVKIIEQLKKEGYKIVIVGDKGHRETKVLSNTAGDSLIGVFKKAEEINGDSFVKVGIVAQSTVFLEDLFEVAKKFIELSKEVRFFNTVCEETLRRQSEAVEIAKNVECMIVIGGKSSANSNRLYELVRRVNKNSFFIQNESDLNTEELKRYCSIGIASGTSTPSWLIKNVIERLQKV